MLSTYVTFLKYAQNYGNTEKRVAKQPIVAREAQYYRDNIGKVKSVDEFLKNYRVFSYAMKAYGLEDMTYAKGFMRKVLLSDLTDATSFANKLTDKRYVEFAKAFNFNAGTGDLTDTTALQNTDQLDDTAARYAAQYPNADRQTNASYYWAKIDTVTSVENIVTNTYLREVALRSVGLDPDTISDDAIRNTLKSDLSDPTSYANTIGDARFVALAASFNFDPDGSVKAGYDAQSGSQTLQTDANYLAPEESTYFKIKLADIGSVDDLLDNERMRSYIVTAFGLDTNITDTALRSVLTSDLTDPNSYANTADDERFVALAGAFNFDTDGSIKSGYDVQSTSQNTALANRYYRETHTDVGTEADFYEEQINNVHSIDDLLKSPHLLSFALTAVGLDPEYTSADAVRAALTSDLSDPSSYANQSGHGKFLAFAQSFNFDTDGSVKSGYDTQSATQMSATVTAYLAAAVETEHDAAADVSTDTAAYKTAIAAAKSINDLLWNQEIVDYILKAYDLEKDNVDTTTLRMVLESDLSDPKSYVNQVGDAKLQALAADFNFTASGSITTARLVQTAKAMEATTTAYADVLGDGASAKVKAETETAYYTEAIKTITSLDGLLADTRITDYIKTAFKLDANTTTATLRAVLTSDTSDARSTASKLGGGYSDLALAFNFTTKGTIAREAGQSAQSAKNVQATYDAYIAQTLETEAGDENEGARLALYFQRMASSIDSAYDILADKALAEVVRTALGISSSAANADIDIQARQITNKLKLSDLKSESFVKKFVAKFAALYDMQNSSTTGSSGAASLISQSLSANTSGSTMTVINFSQDLLSSAMNARKL